jgi:fibronectin-binding autotransporter adhesin
MYSPLRLRLWFVFVIFFAGLFGQSGHLYGQTYTWNNPAGGSWINGVNWSPLGPPPSGTTTILNFGTATQLGTTFTATDDIPGTFTLNQINFAAFGNGAGTPGTITIQYLGLSSLVLDGTNPAINLSVASAGNATVAAPIALNQSAAFNNASIGNTLTISGSVALGATSNLTVTGLGNTTISGPISGTGGLTKNGYGNLTLNSAAGSTYAGNTTVNLGGMLTLDFANMIPSSNVVANQVNPNSNLNLNGGTFNVVAQTTTAAIGLTSNQTLGNLSLGAGASTINLTLNGANGFLNLTLGNTWNRVTGSTLNINMGNNTNLLSSPASSSGTGTIIGGWATIGSDAFASVAGSNISAFASNSLGNFNTASNPITQWSSFLAPNNDVTYIPPAGTGTYGITGTPTANSVLFTSPVPANTNITLTLESTSTNMILTGGLLVGNYVLNGTQKINSGNLVPGGPELFLSAYGTDASVTNTSGLSITSIIGVSGTTSFAVVKSGPETVVLNPSGGPNLYTGGTYINQGVLLFATAAAVPATGAITVNYGGTAAFGVQPTQTTLSQLFASTSTGVVALNTNWTSSVSLAGLPNLSLGASTNATYSAAALTPAGTTYLLGGGGATLTLSTNGVLVGAGNSLIVSYNGTSGPGNVTISGINNTFGGGTTIASTNFGAVPVGNTITLNSTTVTVLSTAGLYVGEGVMVSGGTGTIPVGATIASIAPTNGTNATLTLSVAATLAGSPSLTYFSIPTLTVSNGTSLGTGGVTFNGPGALSVNSAGNPTPSFSATQPFTINGNAIATINIANATAATLTLNAPIGGAGSLNFSAVASGSILALNAASAYGGTTTINSGAIQSGVLNALPTTTVLTLANVAGAIFGSINASFNMANFNQTLGGLAGGGTTGGNILLGSGTLTITNTVAGNTSYGGAIFGTGGVILNLGSFTQTFTGANAFTGNLTINSGTLSVAADSGLGGSTGSVTFNGGTLLATSTFATSASRAFSFAGSAGLSTTQNVALTIAGQVSVGNGVVITASGAGSVTITGTTTLAGAATFTNVSSDALTLGNIVNSSGTLTINGTSSTILSGAVGSGSGGLTLSGTGSVTLQSANTFTGIVTLTSGNLLFNAANQLGNNTTAAALTLNGGALIDTDALGATLPANHGVSVTANSLINVVAAGETLGLQTLAIGNSALSTFGSANVTVNGATTLNGAGAGTAGLLNLSSGTLTLGTVSNGVNTLAVGGPGNVNITGVIGNGPGGLSMQGTGTLTLSAINTYIGATGINSGTVTVTTAGALGSAGALIVNGSLGGTILNLNGSAQSVGSLSGSVAAGAATINLASNGVLTVTQTTPGTFAGIIAGTNASLVLNTASTGALTLSGNNSFTGSVTVNGGSAVLAGNNNFTSTIINGGAVFFGSDAGSGSTPAPLGTTPNSTQAANITLGGGTLFATSTVSLIGTRGITVTAPSTLAAAAGSSLSFKGALTGSAGLTIASGTVIPGGSDSSSYTGTMTVNAGATLTIFGQTALGNTATTAVTLNGGTLNLGGFSPTTLLSGQGIAVTANSTILTPNDPTTAPRLNIGAFTLTDIGVGFSVSGTTTLTGNATIYVGSALSLGAVANGANTLIIAGPGATTISGAIANGSGGLTLTGGGALTLSSPTGNSYTGATTVSSGTLTLAFGSMTTPSNMIAPTSTLTLGGAGNAILNLNAGATNGNASQTLGNLTLANGASSINLAANGSNTMSLTLGNAWTRAIGATVNFSTPTGTSIALSATPLTVNAAGVGTIIGGWATITTSAGTNFAQMSGASIVGLTYTVGQTNQSSWASNDLIYTQAPSPVLPTTQTANSLQLSGTAIYNLALVGTNTLNTGGILVTNTATSGTVALTGGNIVAPSGGELIVNNYDTSGSTFTIGSTIIGVAGSVNFGVTVTGAFGSTTIFTSTNLFTGPLTLNSGTLQFSADASLGAVPTVVTANAVTINGGNLASAASVGLSANRGFIINGSASITEITSGSTLTIAGPVSIANGGVITTPGPGNVTISGAMTFGGNVTFNNNGGTLTLSGSIGGSGNNAITINTSGTAALTISTGTTIFAGASSSMTLNSSSSAATSVVNTSAQVFSGYVNALNITATGAGATTYTGALTFSGVTTISNNTTSGAGATTLSSAIVLGGVTTIANVGANALTLSTGAITAGSNALVFSENALSTAGINVSNAITFTGPGSIVNNGTNSNGLTAITSAITLTGPAGLTITNNAATTLTLSTGAIAAGFSPIVFSGAGATQVSNAITFGSGSSITVNAGAGLVTLAGTVTLAGNGPTTIVNNNASNPLQFTGTLAAGANPLVFGGSGAITVGTLTVNNYVGWTGSGSLTLGNVTLGSTTTFNNTGTGAFNVAGTVSNNQAFAFTGTGLTTISGPVAYTSGVTITNSSPQNNAINGAITFGASATLASYGAGVLTIGAGGITFTGSGLTLTLNGPGNTTITGPISGATALALSAVANGINTGVVTLGSAANSFTGNVSVGSGVLSVGLTGELGQSTSAGALTLSGGTLMVSGTMTQASGAGATVTVAGSTINVASGATFTTGSAGLTVAGVNFITMGGGNVTASGGTTLTGSPTFTNNLGGSLNLGAVSANNFTLTFAGTGNTTVGALSTGSGAVTLIGVLGNNLGAGTTTFTSTNNSYSGTTTIEAGTLVITSGGSQAPLGTGALTMYNGTLQINPAGSSSSSALGGSSVLTVDGGATVLINSSNGGGANKTTFTFGPDAGGFTRGVGGAVIFSAGNGVLGTDALFVFSTSPPVPTFGIVPAYMVGTQQVNTNGTNASFLTYGTSLSVYTGATTLPTIAGSSSVTYTTSTGVALTGPTSAYALQVNSGAIVTVTGQTLTLGNAAAGSGVAGLILNAGAGISGGALAFAAGATNNEGIIYVNGASTISSNLTGSVAAGSVGLTIFGPVGAAGALTGNLTLSGNNSGLGGTLVINNVTVTVGSPQNLNNGGAMTLRGALNIAPTTPAAFATTETISTGIGGGAIINVNNPGFATTFSSNLTLTTNAPLAISSTANSNLVFSGVVTIAAATMTIAGAGNVNFTGSVTVATGGSLINNANNGAGTVTLAPNANNTVIYTSNSGTTSLQGGAAFSAAATLNLNGGVVAFGSSNALQVSGTMTINGGTFDLSGNNSSIGALAGVGGTITNGLAADGPTGAATATLTLLQTLSTTYTGTITDGTGQLGLTINSPTTTNATRTLTLAGNNTYSGPTTLAAGSTAAGTLVIGSTNALQNSTLIDNVFSTGVSFASNTTFFVANATFGGLAGIGNLTLPALPLTLSVGNNNQNTEFSGVISGGSVSLMNFTKIGGGTLALGGVNTFAGLVTVNDGALQTIAPNTLFGTTTVTSVNPGNNITVSGVGVFDLYSLNQVALSLAGNGTVTTGAFPLATLSITGLTATANANFSGVISGNGGLTKTNASTSIQVLSGFNPYTGATTVNGGTLQLSFLGDFGNNSNVISSGSSVTLGGVGGTLLITASNISGSVSSQTFNGLTASQTLTGQTNAANVAVVANALTLANSVGGAALNVSLGGLTLQNSAALTITLPTAGINTLNLGAVSRPTGGSVLNLTLPVSGAVNTVTTSNSAGAGGLLVDQNGAAFAVINGTSWAAVSSGNVVTATYTANQLGAGVNTDITIATAATANATASIRFNAAAVTLTLNSGPTILGTGGILLGTSAAGTETIAANASGSALQSATNEFVLVANGHNLIINAPLQNASATPTNVTIGGNNTTSLIATNTYTGTTTILPGATLSVDNGSATPAGSINGTSAIFNYGTLTFNSTGTNVISLPATTTITGTGPINVSGAGSVTLGGTNTSGLLTNSNGVLTLGGPLIGSGNLTNASGEIILNSPNSTFTGATTITAGFILVNSGSALQNSAVTVNSTAAVGLQFGASVTTATLGSLAGTTTLTTNVLLNAGMTLTVGGNNATTSYVGAISGGGSFTKTGTGALTLSGPNVYMGNTTVANGTLLLSFPSSTNANFPNGNTTGILYNQDSSSYTPGNLILGGSTTINGNSVPSSGILSITNTGGGNSESFNSLVMTPNTLSTLALANDTTGLTLNVGSIVRSSSPVGPATVNSSTGSVLLINGPNSTSLATTLNVTAPATSSNVLVDASGTAFGVINSSDWAAVSGSQIVTLSSLSGYTTNFFGAAVNTDVQSSFTANDIVTNTIRYSFAAGAVTVTLTAPTTTITTGGVLLGSAATSNLTIAGVAGTSLVSASNEFVFVAAVAHDIIIGAVAVPSGAVLADNGSGISTGLTFVGTSATSILQINSVPAYTGPTSVQSVGELQFQFTGGNAVAPLFYSTSGFFISGLLNFNAASGFQQINGVITGSGNVSQTGAVTTVLAAANTYTGTTTINAGTIQLGINNGVSTASALTMNGGTLNLNGFNQALGSLAGLPTSGLMTGGVIQGGTGTSILTVGSLNTTTTFFGTIIDGGGQVSLVKVGTGALYLTGANTYSGSTTVSGGALIVAAPTNAAGFASPSIGTGNLTVTNLNTGAGTTVLLVLNDLAQTVGSLNAGIANGGTVATPSSGVNIVQISLGPNSVLTINQTAPGNFGGNITGGNGSLTLGSASISTLTLSNFNYYGGITTINGGVLSVSSLAVEGATGGVGSGIGASGNEAANLVLNGGTLQYTGAAASTDRLFTLGPAGGVIDASGTGKIVWSNTGLIAFSLPNDPTLTLTGTGLGSLAPILSDNGTAPAVLSKTGTGAWFLTSPNTYSGGTTISAGVLVAANTTGSATGTGNVVVNNSGTLAGYGTIAATSGNNVTVNGGGTIRGGYADGTNNYGTLNISNNVVVNSTGTTSSTMGTITTEVLRVASGPLGVNQFGIGTATTGAGNASLINLSGSSSAVFNLNPSYGSGAYTGKINVNILDTTGSSLVPNTTYTINLVQATTPGNPTVSTDFTYDLNGVTTTIKTNGSTPTVIDSGGPLINGIGQGTFTTLNLASNMTYANSVSSWALQVSANGEYLQLSLATPEPHYALLLCAAAMLIGLAVRGRIRARAAIS